MLNITVLHYTTYIIVRIMTDLDVADAVANTNELLDGQDVRHIISTS